MGALAQLSQSRVDVEPGRSATITITVRNTGTVVDRYTFEALGDSAPWVTFRPESLSLFPEASGTIDIVLAPPRLPTVHAGPTPLGVRVASSEDPPGSVVEEATVNVGPFSDITLELVPRVARGRIMARTQLAVDNRSNCSYRAELSGTDPQMTLQFRFRPSVVDIGPGNAQFVKVGIRPIKRFWKGPERTRPFQLILRDEQSETDEVGSLVGATPPLGIAGVDTTPPGGTPAVGGAGRAGPGSGGPAVGGPAAGVGGRGWGGRGWGAAAAGGARTGPGTGPPQPPADSPSRTFPTDVARPGTGAGATEGPGAGPDIRAERVPSPHKEEFSIDGSMLQEPLLPRWLLAAVSALVALALLLLILWFALFKPQIKSTAQNQVNKQLTANGITPVTSSGASKTGSGAGGSSGGGAGGGSGSGGGGGGSTATTLVTGGNSGGTGGTTVNGGAQAVGNGTKVVFIVPNGRSLQVTDILVENSAGDTGNLSLARSGVPVMQWSMANFRDLDYHWITPTVFGPGTQMQLVVSGCSGACTPGIYYAGHLVTG